MSTKGSLSQQVEAYHNWKKELIRQISRYRLWLRENDLFSDDISERIRSGLELLSKDELTLAFVGEFSRGKTELINALFFSEFGQRILPSQAGRTTMCPTELFFDRDRNRNYLELLPIETRREAVSLRALQQDPDRWIHRELNTESPETMREVLQEVARVRSVTAREARELGFDERMLDQDPDTAGNVLVPAWRSARISVRHPLFERGLRILDTPGLNALGSEPELTISMLPAAHAVLFLLSADTGVTASDLAIWKEHVATKDADHRAGRFAILNKIDTLWDDLDGEEASRSAVARIRKETARHLNIDADNIVPVSAKQGLIGKAREDDGLYEASGMANLERLIVDRILHYKEELITQSLINDLIGMLQNSQSAMQQQLASMREELEACHENHLDRLALKKLAERAQTDYDYYHRKLITLRSSRRLMQSQGDALREIVDEQHFDDYELKVWKLMDGSWTTAGMNRAMNHFFELLETDFSSLLTEGRLAEKMVDSIYRRYTEDTNNRHIQPIPLRAGRHLIALRDLRQKADRFRRNPKNLFMGQNKVIERFFTVIVTEARQLHDRVRADVERWPKEALLPIMQAVMEQKRLLEHQIKRVRDMAENDRTLRHKREELTDATQALEHQLALADNMLRQIRRPPPTIASQKVVNLSGIA